MATKMTEKEMFTHIAETLADEEAVVAFCEKKIAALERKAATAKAKAAEKKVAGDELRDRVQALLTDELQTIAEVTTALADEDVSSNKVAYRLNSLVDAGIAVKEDTKVAGSDGKAKVVKAFKLA